VRGATTSHADTLVLRPRRARAVVYVCATALFVVLVGIAVLLPSEGPSRWGPGSRIAVVLVALACVWFLHRLASVRVETDDVGVTVVNILRRRRLDWAEVVGVRFSRDDAWLMLDVSDGSSLAAMGVMKSEGERGQEQARQFARLVTEHSPTDDAR
jgi:hypothetical protein